MTPSIADQRIAPLRGEVNRTRQTESAPGGTRTPDPLLRRQLLYPPELQARPSHSLGTTSPGSQVGEIGFEPTTSCSQGRRANQAAPLPECSVRLGFQGGRRSPRSRGPFLLLTEQASACQFQVSRGQGPAPCTGPPSPGGSWGFAAAQALFDLGPL